MNLEFIIDLPVLWREDIIMVRALRVEYSGARYHVMCRGDLEMD